MAMNLFPQLQAARPSAAAAPVSRRPGVGGARPRPTAARAPAGRLAPTVVSAQHRPSATLETLDIGFQQPVPYPVCCLF